MSDILMKKLSPPVCCLILLYLFVIQKLSEKQLHSWQRGATMPAVDRDLLMFIFHSSLTLIKPVLAQVIDARGVKFQDTSALQAFFRTFTVLCSVPVGSMDSPIVNEVCIILHVLSR